MPNETDAQRHELTRTTDKYHALFPAMDQGFCLLEVLFDETGQQAVDYRYLELNPVFARQSGMPADALGKTIRELMPDIEPFWFDTFGRVALTGQAVRQAPHRRESRPGSGRRLSAHPGSALAAPAAASEGIAV